MSKNMQLLTRALVGFAFIVFSLGCGVATAQTEVTGTWTASLDNGNTIISHRVKRDKEKIDKRDKEDKADKSNKTGADSADQDDAFDDENFGASAAAAGQPTGDRLYLNFERGSARNHRNQMGHTFAFSELQGLTREQVERGGAVKFSLVREAGTVTCEGTFQNGKGSGSFTFTANAGFVSAMKSRGFDFEKTSKAWGDERDEDNKLFSAAVINVTTALADDLLSADLGKLDIDDLFKAAIFHVDSKFAREMKASGFQNLGMEELVKARIFKIDPNFVSQVTQMGFSNEPFESLVKMRIFKVTPEFIAMARTEGLTDLSVEELVKLRIFKIDSEFIRKARAEGVPLNVQRLVERRIGVPRN